MRARFAQFTIDSETRQLLSAEGELHLSPKAFDLLCGLIVNRPKVVEKADLHARIWPNTYVVDANLNILIGEIRRAIGDSARNPKSSRRCMALDMRSVALPWTSSHRTARQALLCWVVWNRKTYQLSRGR